MINDNSMTIRAKGMLQDIKKDEFGHYIVSIQWFSNPFIGLGDQVTLDCIVTQNELGKLQLKRFLGVRISEGIEVEFEAKYGRFEQVYYGQTDECPEHLVKIVVTLNKLHFCDS